MNKKYQIWPIYLINLISSPSRGILPLGCVTMCLRRWRLALSFLFLQFSWFPEESNQYSTDLMARALMDSTIFVVFISTSYAEDRSCTDIFKYAKLTLGKPMVVVVVGEDNYSWRKTNLGLLLPDVVSDRKGINSHLTGVPLPLLPYTKTPQFVAHFHHVLWIK